MDTAGSRPSLAQPAERECASYGRQLARDAATWLQEHLTEALTVRDLCRALNVRERTLHASFQEYLGTTPKAYFKSLRLSAARRDLLRAQDGTRVTDVALYWGFLHFGWFSHDYRRFWGETPSETLRRRGGLVHTGAAGPVVGRSTSRWYPLAG